MRPTDDNLGGNPADWILITGIPRSGTTWVGRVLGSVASVVYLHEPDNEGISALAAWAKRGLPRFPYLEGPEEHPRYEELWRHVCQGRLPGRVTRKVLNKLVVKSQERAKDRAARPASATDKARIWLGGHLTLAVGQLPGRFPGRRIVKSVHGLLALPWIRQRFAPRVVLVKRHPFAVAASSMRLNTAYTRHHLFDQDGLVHEYAQNLTSAELRRIRRCEDPLEIAGFQLALATRYQRSFVAAQKPIVVRHEDLVETTIGGFHDLFTKLHLPWSSAVEEMLDMLDTPGSGFTPKRRTKELHNSWKRELSAAQIDRLGACFATMGVEVSP